MAKTDSKPLPPFTASDIERFWAKVDKRGPDECWPWIAGFYPEGYGKFGSGGRTLGAHRVAYFLTTGIDPSPLFVCHSCDNRYCCNGAHLFPGTTTDNMRDSVAKGRMATGVRHGSKTKPGNLPIGESHFMAKLSDEQVIDIRQLYATGRFTQYELGIWFDVTQGLISQIVLRKIWSHLP